MDQIKIGKFIAECRRKKDLTQKQLAEKLNVTDRAVSKWENGRAMPDSSIMLSLCDILKISVNDLLCGEMVSMDKYNKELEKRLLETIKQKEEADRRLLMLEVFIGITAVVSLLAIMGVAIFVQMDDWLRVVLIAVAFVIFLVGCFCALRIEQVAGYYECPNCGHRYVPTYLAMNRAPHMGRTRFLKCPKCGVREWQKKVLTKE